MKTVLVGSSGFAGEWLPPGQAGVGPVTTVRGPRIAVGPSGPTFPRLADIARRPACARRPRQRSLRRRFRRGRIQRNHVGAAAARRGRRPAAPSWQASAIVATRPWQERRQFRGRTSIDAQYSRRVPDADDSRWPARARERPARGARHRARLEPRMRDLSAAVFHDRLDPYGGDRTWRRLGSPDFLQDYFSAGVCLRWRSRRVRPGLALAYREKVPKNLTTTVVYAYAGALAPNGALMQTTLREELATRYRQSLAARISGHRPPLRHEVHRELQVVQRTDRFSAGCLRRVALPHRSVSEPGDPAASARASSRATWKSRPMWVTCLRRATSRLRRARRLVVLVPSYRYFRGGLSLQF